MKHIFKSQDSHVLGVCLSHVSRVGVTVVCAWYTTYNISDGIQIPCKILIIVQDNYTNIRYLNVA